MSVSEQIDPHVKGYQIAEEKLKNYLPDNGFPYDDIFDIIADAYAEGWIDNKEKSIQENLPDSQ